MAHDRPGHLRKNCRYGTVCRLGPAMRWRRNLISAQKAEGKSAWRWTWSFSAFFMAFQGYRRGLARLLLRISPIRQSVPFRGRGTWWHEAQEFASSGGLLEPAPARPRGAGSDRHRSARHQAPAAPTPSSWIARIPPVRSIVWPAPRLCERFGFELKGTGFLAHWDAQSALSLAALLRQSLEARQPLCLSSIAATAGQWHGRTGDHPDAGELQWRRAQAFLRPGADAVRSHAAARAAPSPMKGWSASKLVQEDEPGPMTTRSTCRRRPPAWC